MLPWLVRIPQSVSTDLQLDYAQIDAALEAMPQRLLPLPACRIRVP